MSGLLTYVQDQQQYIGLLLLSHIQLTLLSVAIAVCIGVPLGIYISERERLLKLSWALPIWRRLSPVWRC